MGAGRRRPGSGRAVLLILKNLLFTVLVPGTVSVFLPFVLSSRIESVPLLRVALACIPFLLGAAIYLWCLWDFAFIGRGTPAPMDAPKQLVQRGLYRYSRNPMYVGVLTVVLGWVVLKPAVALAIYLVVVAVAFQLFVVLYEEPTLRRSFGNAYESYCTRVPRWIGWSGGTRPDGPP